MSSPGGMKLKGARKLKMHKQDYNPDFNDLAVKQAGAGKSVGTVVS